MYDFFRRNVWRLVISLVLIVSAIAGIRLYYNLTDDFRIANIQYDIPNRAEWEVEPLSLDDKQAIDEILHQPFSYIGKGAQSYAFGSADGKYVLKFFKFKHLRPSWFVDLVPSQAYRETQQKRKTRKLEGVFAGYHLAYERHKPESGLIYIHLNKTQNTFPEVVVTDKLGRAHEIDLDSVVFILQERAKPVREVFQNQLKQNDITAVLEGIDSILALYMGEYAKGIYDNDHGVMRNVGFVGTRPIHLDVGKLKQNESIKEQEAYSKDLVIVGHRMAVWFREHEPEHYHVIKEDMEHKFSNLTGTSFVLMDEHFY